MSPNPSPHPNPADSFDDWWDREGEWVEPPNRRRGGESGVKRIQDAKLGLLYLKRQIGHVYRDLLHPLGRPTVLRERAALLALPQIGITVPPLVYCGVRRDGGWRGLLVTGALTGYLDVKRWYTQGGRDRLAGRHDDLLRKIGAMLGTLHRHRWQHACLYWKHIFISTDAGADGLPGVALIDLEKTRRRLTAALAAGPDLRQLRRRSVHWEAGDWARIMEGHAGAMRDR